MASDYKKYTIQAKRCIKGESFFESLLSDYAIPHHVVGAKDLGIDYFCEWVHEDRPTGILFAAQVKTFSNTSYKLISKGINTGKNNLEIYEIINSNLKVNNSTISYWRGLAIPVYLFAISEDSSTKGMTAFYKRYTPVITTSEPNFLADYRGEYYKVSIGHEFLAFSDKKTRSFGFARDLFIDYMRCTYSKGSISYLNPRAIGLNQFPEDRNVFPELFKDYSAAIGSTFEILKAYIGEHLSREKVPESCKKFGDVSAQFTSVSDISIKKL